MVELKGILPRIYREVKRSENFAGEVVKRETRVKYDHRQSRFNREKFSKIWPHLRKGWFYFFSR